jgi:hypothetical protein
MSQTRGDALWSIDDLELELRKLPGVRAAGFDELDDMLLVQLHVSEQIEAPSRNDRADQPVTVSASRIAARHSDRPVAIEIVRWRTSAPVALELPAGTPTEAAATTAPVAGAEAEAAAPARARLLAVLAFPDTDELEVHLVLEGKRTIGRAMVSKGIEGTVQATIDAVRDLGAEIHPRVRWARAVDDADDDQVVVAVALDDVDDRTASQYGLASGTSLIDAAARATLDALNRHLSRTA